MTAINTIYIQHAILWNKMYKHHVNHVDGNREGLQLYKQVG